MILDNICVVLVEPKGSLNIGSVSRVMLNFGLSNLRLVNPAASHLNDEARRMAVKSTPLLEKAAIYATLGEALADCHVAMATTRRFGKYRQRLLLPEEAAKEIIPLAKGGMTALVFGREDHGLSTDEIDHCQHILTIPTHPDLKSLNLSQSVGICLYEIFRAYKSDTNTDAGGKKFASGESQEAMFSHMQETLSNVDFLDPQNPQHIIRTFRKIFGRAHLDEREVKILQGLWSRIDWIDAQRPKE